MQRNNTSNSKNKCQELNGHTDQSIYYQLLKHMLCFLLAYARLAHPFQAGVLDHVLNDAMGNVFVTSKSTKRRN